MPLVSIVMLDRRHQQKRGAAGLPAQNTWMPYVWAILCVAAVLALRVLYAPVFGNRGVLLLFALPVVVLAMYHGAGPALLATVLSTVVSAYFLGVQWTQSIDQAQQSQIVLFLGVCLTISWLGGQLKATQAELAALAFRDAQRKDVFLAMLGHELRNPLAGISSAAQLLTHAAMDPHSVPETAHIITRQVAHMTHLINDLLDVSRVTRGQVVIEKAPVDLIEVMHTAVEQVSALVEARQHRLVLDLPSAPVWVLGDNTRLVQVVSNLLVNAARYTPLHGVLTLRLSAMTDQAHVAVQDNGVGIAPELAAHVFEFFVQAKRSTDGVMGGLGLGLSLVKSMVEAHGGKVSVHSAGLGHGSTFSLSLPLFAAAKFSLTPAVEPVKPPQAAAPQTLDILVVDDNRDAAQPLAMLLQFDGHRVSVAHSAQEALQQAEQSRFDVAILDIGLPDMSGYTLARRIRDMPQHADTTLIALTGYGTETDKARALDAGFNQHLVKPIDDAQLSAALKLATQHATHSLTKTA